MSERSHDDKLERKSEEQQFAFGISNFDDDSLQPGLFADDRLPREDLAYRVPTACEVAGITYRQLDYWARTGLVVPSIRGAQGSGSQRLYSFKDILVLKIVKGLSDTGVSLQNIRTAVEHLRDHGITDLARITLFSDGRTVYECTSPEDVFDLLRGGQAVFGIAVSGTVKELSGSISAFPSERVEHDEIVPTAEISDIDELADRRMRRNRRTG